MNPETNCAMCDEVFDKDECTYDDYCCEWFCEGCYPNVDRSASAFD